MIRFEAKPLYEYFYRGGRQLLEEIEVSFFDKRRHLFSPAVFAGVLFVGLLTLTFFNRTAFVLLIVEVVGLAFLYMKAFVAARGLTVRRILPVRSLREKTMIDVVVEVKNRSGFSVSGLVIDDLFSAAKDARVHIAPERLPSYSMVRLSYKRSCDGGMGHHTIGPLVARFTDDLGIFEFRVSDDTPAEIEVHPHVEAIPDVEVRPSNDSSRYGNYEAAHRGLSVNFSGVRPYARGDSLRHIAWRLSSRGQGLLVKEFEKVVSCEVNIVLNMSPHWQIGRHSNSTWEYGKDIALALVRQQLDLGNSIAFFSDRSWVEPGAGDDHFHHLARHVADLKPVRDEDSVLVDPPNVLGRYRDFYVRGSNIFYIVPYNKAELERSRSELKALQIEGFHVTLVLIDTDTFWVQFLESLSTGLLIGAKLMQDLDEAVDDFERCGIRVYVAKNRVPVRDVFRPKSGGRK